VKRIKKIIIIVGILSLFLLSGCMTNTILEDCESIYPDIDNCEFAKCLYDDSLGYSPEYRADFLTNYYNCRIANGE